MAGRGPSPPRPRVWGRFWKTCIGRASAGPTNDRASCSFRIVSSTPSELVVISPLKDWACSSCGGTGGLLIMDDSGPLCMQCAELDHLVFLPSGDAALTRRARRDSRLSTVVVRFSRARGRYERQGVLVEEAALEQAEAACLADQPARARRRERDAARRANQDLKPQDEIAKPANSYATQSTASSTRGDKLKARPVVRGEIDPAGLRRCRVSIKPEEVARTT